MLLKKVRNLFWISQTLIREHYFYSREGVTILKKLNFFFQLQDFKICEKYFKILIIIIF